MSAESDHPEGAVLSAPSANHSSSSVRPTVIGIYGLPGSGKSTLLRILQSKLSDAAFNFIEGSEKIASLLPDGLNEFHLLNEDHKAAVRKQAIDEIKVDAAHSGRAAIVAGHYMFWAEEMPAGRPVCTPNDLATFTHIIYLAIPPEVILQQCLNDAARPRQYGSVGHFQRWQHQEIGDLRHLCRQHNILFSAVSNLETVSERVTTLIQNFCQGHRHGPSCDVKPALAKVDDIVSRHNPGQLSTCLVMDADKTLAAEDSGTLFWQRVPSLHVSRFATGRCPLKDLFGGPLGYTTLAFQQATLMYEDAADDMAFEAYCDSVASVVKVYPQFVSLLRATVDQEHVGALVVTCGLRRVWEKVLEREGFAGKVTVIGGGRLSSDGLVVTPQTKMAIVQHLQDKFHLNVWAFGDSPLDVPMLKTADRAIVVVGDEGSRSLSMDEALKQAIFSSGLKAQQVLLPGGVVPRLDVQRLPVVHINDPIFVEEIMRRSTSTFHVATDMNSAKLLMAPMRDASVAGPSLREAHRRAGWYLAVQFVTEVIGMEEYSISHVGGTTAVGHRLRDEQKTTILALMRGGEPMALGVNDALPEAMFVHASTPTSLEAHHLHSQETVIVVDSVINNGHTMIAMIRRIRSLHRTIRIVVVTGVVQAQVLISSHELFKVMQRNDVKFIALRASQNKYTGTKTTDTGNRLFNTTHLA